MVACKIENYVVLCKIVQCGKNKPKQHPLKNIKLQTSLSQRGLINMNDDENKDVIMETYLYCITLVTSTLNILFSKVLKLSIK